MARATATRAKAAASASKTPARKAPARVVRKSAAFPADKAKAPTAPSTAAAKPAEADKPTTPPKGQVWVVDGQPLYHRNITCERLIVPEKETVKLRQADEDGFEPCPLCYPEKVAAAPVAKAPPVVHVPCEVSASWQEWHDAIKRGKFTGRRLAMPILGCVSIGTDEVGTVVVQSTDLELFVETKIPKAYMDGTGPLLVNAAMLLNALDGIKGGLTGSQSCCERVSVIRDKLGHTTLTGFGRVLKLGEGSAPDQPGDFPSWPKGEPRTVARFGSGEFLSTFEFALTATGRDDTLPMLTAVQMNASDGRKLEFAATDRYRLAVTPVEAVVEAKFQVLLPRSAHPVLKALTGRTEMLMEAKATTALFKSGNISVSVRLMDASFPQYKSLLPTEGSTWVVNRAQLIGDIIAASAIRDNNAPVHITFDPGKYQVEGCEFHQADGEADGNWRMGFNPQYLLDGLRAFHGDEVSLMGTTSTKPMLITGRRFNHHVMYMIMPVRLPS